VSLTLRKREIEEDQQRFGLEQDESSMSTYIWWKSSPPSMTKESKGQEADVTSAMRGDDVVDVRGEGIRTLKDQEVVLLRLGKADQLDDGRMLSSSHDLDFLKNISALFVGKGEGRGGGEGGARQEAVV
jgi:hypothetical protein